MRYDCSSIANEPANSRSAYAKQVNSKLEVNLELMSFLQPFCSY